MSLQLVPKIDRCLWSITCKMFQCGRMLCSTRSPGDDSKIEYRSFQKSSTCQCIRLPLKKSRLANPFPDPLKIIVSDTVSDEEKASNMQLMSRLPEYPTKASVGQSRRFSTKSGCEGGNNKTCKKVTNAKCNKSESNECESSFKRKACEKQEAPFDSFSDLYRASLKPLKRTECNSCPRKTTPASEIKAKKYHTSATTFDKHDEHDSEAEIRSIEAYVKTHNFPYQLSGSGFPTNGCSRGVTGYSRPFTYFEYRLVKKDGGDNYKGRIGAFENDGIDEKCKEKKDSTKECPKDLLVKKKREYKPKGDK